VPVDDVIGNLPFIVRRDHRIVAAFAKKTLAEEWAQMRSWNDESRFTVHTAAEVRFEFQEGKVISDPKVPLQHPAVWRPEAASRIDVVRNRG
jgi:hypothetical protein